MKKLIGLIFLGLIITSCGVDRSEYVLGDNKFKIYSKGSNSLTSLQTIRKDWNEQARKYCPSGYQVVEVDEGFIPGGSFGNISKIDGIVKCK